MHALTCTRTYTRACARTADLAAAAARDVDAVGGDAGHEAMDVGAAAMLDKLACPAKPDAKLVRDEL